MGKSFPSLEVVLGLYFSMMVLGMYRRILLSTLVFFRRVMIHAFPSGVTAVTATLIATSNFV